MLADIEAGDAVVVLDAVGDEFRTLRHIGAEGTDGIAITRVNRLESVAGATVDDGITDAGRAVGVEIGAVIMDVAGDVAALRAETSKVW